MRVLYVAPRYHTNQIPVMKGWIQQGDEVHFISQFAVRLEDYAVLRPIVLGYSKLFECVTAIYRFLLCRKEKSDAKEFAFRVKAGFPPVGEAGRLLRELKPDLVILRERSVYNIPFSLVCRKKRIPCILYNQSPLWDKPDRDMGWRKKIFLRFLPKVRMTPVAGRQENGNIRMPYSYFVPFIAQPRYSVEEKPHFTDGQIRILCVGRYEERKNLFLLLEAVRQLAARYPIHLVIAGEAIDQNQLEYYASLGKKIVQYHLEKDVTLLQNLKIARVYEEYKKADLFVLPSTRERASIAQLEAMSCSLPVICSDTNGSACYVENGVNGWLFTDNDGADLRDKIESLVSDRNILLEMGRSSYTLVREKYQFENYYQKITDMINGEQLI